MSFRISGLSPSTFAPLFALSDAELTARRARRMVADRKPGFPQDARSAQLRPDEIPEQLASRLLSVRCFIAARVDRVAG